MHLFLYIEFFEKTSACMCIKFDEFSLSIAKE